MLNKINNVYCSFKSYSVIVDIEYVIMGNNCLIKSDNVLLIEHYLKKFKTGVIGGRKFTKLYRVPDTTNKAFLDF